MKNMNDASLIERYNGTSSQQNWNFAGLGSQSIPSTDLQTQAKEAFPCERTNHQNFVVSPRAGSLLRGKISMSTPSEVAADRCKEVRQQKGEVRFEATCIITLLERRREVTGDRFLWLAMVYHRSQVPRGVRSGNCRHPILARPVFDSPRI